MTKLFPVYRVLARHRTSREWAGISMLCVDEFAPTVAFQEDTSVVRAHRGHRLGLLMKADMLRWISQERPEVTAADTWNATNNHHMIAVNERLGATVIAVFSGTPAGGRLDPARLVGAHLRRATGRARARATAVGAGRRAGRPVRGAAALK